MAGKLHILVSPSGVEALIGAPLKKRFWKNVRLPEGATPEEIAAFEAEHLDEIDLRQWPRALHAGREGHQGRRKRRSIFRRISQGRSSRDLRSAASFLLRARLLH